MSHATKEVATSDTIRPMIVLLEPNSGWPSGSNRPPSTGRVARPSNNQRKRIGAPFATKSKSISFISSMGIPLGTNTRLFERLEK